jgi:hypothetical protein
MEKVKIITGSCPVKNANVDVKVTYVHSSNCWEKGISEPPCSSPCSGGCPILDSAPDELGSL